MQTLPLELQEYLLRFTGKHWSIAVRACRSWWYLIRDPWQRSQINQRIFYSTLITPSLAYWARINGAEKNGRFTTVLARLGRFEELKALFKWHYEFNEETLLGAVRGAQLEIFNYLIKEHPVEFPTQMEKLSLSFIKRVLKEAVLSGSISMVERVLFLYGEELAKEAGFVACYMAVEQGDLPMLSWLLAKGFPINSFDFLAAVRTRNISMLDYLWKEGAVWDSRALSMAFDTRSREVLLWFLEHPVKGVEVPVLKAKEEGWF